MYYFNVVDLIGITTIKEPTKKEIIKRYNEILESYNYISISKIKYQEVLKYD